MRYYFEGKWKSASKFMEKTLVNKYLVSYFILIVFYRLGIKVK